MTENSSTGRSPREIIRTAAADWFAARTSAMSGFDPADVRQHVRHAASRSHRYPVWPANEAFRRHVTEVLAYVPPLTVDEQREVERYFTEDSRDAALTIQLALG